MRFGILEDHSGLQNVPGTSLLDSETNETLSHLNHLKKGTHKNSHIVLVPQPSNDPNDPLNWPLWQRDLILCLFCTCTLLCTAGIGPILSSIALPLIAEFDVTFTQISLLSGYNLCATGAAGIFISAFAHKYGKRPTMIISMTLALAGTLWGGASQSYKSLLGARIVQGFGVAMFESVMFSVIGDLYFVHERGARMALYTTSGSGIGNLPAMLSGKISATMGWRWVFWLLAIFIGISLVLVILFGWETAYRRSAIYETDTSSQNNLEIIEELKRDKSVHVEVSDESPADNTAGNQMQTLEIAASTIIRRESMIHRMALFHGTFTDDNLLKLIIKPFAIIINPAVVWAVLSLSFPILWLVCISFVIAQIFSAPPYLLDATAVGYLSAGPLIGGTLGCLLCGYIADPLVKWISRRNNGIYEPEFRLVLTVGTVIFSALGYFLFGNLIGEGKSPAGMAAIWGVISVTAQFVSISVGTYMLDAYREINVEIFIMSMIFKNFLFFGFSFFLNDWIARWGPPKLFNTIGGIQLGICATAIPLWVFGKRMRAWWHTHDMLKNI